jgi:transcriptional regulator NrdR family protein
VKCPKGCQRKGSAREPVVVGLEVSQTRPLAREPHVIRRHRRCPECGLEFKTEERPSLLVRRDDGSEPFFRGLLLDSLRRAAADVAPRVPDRALQDVVGAVVAELIAAGNLQPKTQELVGITGAILESRGLKHIAYRLDPASNPDTFQVTKRDGSEEPFMPAKLRRAIQGASMTFVDSRALDRLVTAVAGHFLDSSIEEVDVEMIREQVDERLKQIDERAYMRYALAHSSSGRTLNEFLESLDASSSERPQVVKRTGERVAFDREKLARSIRRSFVRERRNELRGAISEFVEKEAMRVRVTNASGRPEPTETIGDRVQEWLFTVDERAWAAYWLAFASDHATTDLDDNPIAKLEAALNEMRHKREVHTTVRAI